MAKEAPHRQYEINIQLSADSWEDAKRQIVELAEHVAEHGPACNSVSGGYSTGHIVEVKHDPAMTHERWAAELEAYLAERNTERTPISPGPVDGTGRYVGDGNA